MLLTILGCSGRSPGPDAAASGYLVEADGFRLVMDFGSGVLAALQTRCDPFAIDALVLTRLLPDHCSDLTALTVLRRYHSDPPYDTTARKLEVHAPSGAPDRFARAYAENDEELATTDLSDVYDFQLLVEGTIRRGPFEISVVRTGSVFGIRIATDEASLVYGSSAELASGADVLLAEAGCGVGAVATTAGVGMLILTHIAPWEDPVPLLAEARAAFTGPVELARQGTSYRIG
ncbi:MBL fold metallo-hydrolase [Umezawaea sp.]|uniref:MBL fold metallo-hydrolase n=1 Tax=Umezawaea sp. TaxID=1955258 RepID=UPI002ED1F1E0